MPNRVMIVASVVVAAALAAMDAQAISLTEAMALAYGSNPTLQAQRAALRATDETVSTALGGYRPTVQIAASGSEAESNSNRTTLANGRTSPRSSSLTFTQPLYRGGRTEAGVDQAEANIRAGRATLRNTEQTVLLAAVRAYMDVLRDQAIVDLNQNNEERLRRQLQATLDRFEVGEVTRTDVAQAQARLSRATSDRIAAQGTLLASRGTFLSTVGAPADELARVPALEGVPDTEDEAIGVGLAENPLIEQATFVERAADRAVRAARGSLFPTVNLSGSVSHSEEANTRGTETDSQSVTASVTIPLYQSGSEYATVRQQKQTANQRRIEIELQRRSVRESVTRSWAALSSASDRIRSGVDQVRAAEIALDGVRQEAEVGSRTTLDVLDSEQELLDARVALVRAERDEYVAGFELRAAIGRLSAADLNLPVDRYDPVGNYAATRNRLIGTGIRGE
ncbi:MAG: TolC family outer membrane protein [Alphaproteobacteria bacterium]|nr:TolC family outer membrane protein [Alphaproteobacteria bacterium]